MLRPSGRLGLALLLLASCVVPLQQSLAQTPPSLSARASSNKAATTPAHNSKARAKKSVPAPEVPQTPPPPPTLEQQPPAPPQVSYQNGQLTIDSQNATLSQVLRSVQVQTGASIDMPSGAGSERVVATLGPGKPKDVIASLLNGSKFNYVILGEPNNSERVQKIILLSKNTTGGDSAAVTTAQNNVRSPSPPQQAVEPPEDEYPPPEQETENQNPLQPGQPGMPGSEGLTPDVINTSPGQPAAGRTPEQMLLELQRMQQQQQQMQQQLNPANQQSTPFPSQPAPMAPQPQ